MPERSNIWGGSFEISFHQDQAADDGRFLDSSSYQAPAEEEVKQSWLLRPPMEKENRNKKRCCMNRALVTTLVWAAIVTGLLVLIALLVTRPQHHHPLASPDNYTTALRQALLFFNAQRSGRLPADNYISWRGDSCLNDGEGYLWGLEGGYYDGGDAIKYNFPASFAMTILSWSVLEYRAKYEAAGELNHVKDIIKWGTDYLLKTFNSTGKSVNRIASQVGGGEATLGAPNDRNCWIRPESITYPRPVSECNSNCPALAAEMAAALAAASIVFNDNPNYSKKLVHAADILFKFATKKQGDHFTGGGDPPSHFYNSTGFRDELVWGAAWMYCATAKTSYLHLATIPDLAKHSEAFWVGPNRGVLSWDNKHAGAQLLLTRMRMFLDYGYPYEEMLKKFHDQINEIMCSYLPDFQSFNRTRGGLIQLNHGRPQPLQYVVNAAFLASLYRDYLEASITPGWQCGPTFYPNEALQRFAKTQMDYILGKNPRSMSYVVGFGERFPQYVHHKGASISENVHHQSCGDGLAWKDSKYPNPNTIVGAMVAGPDRYDNFQDNRINYNFTEPTIAGNAGLVAALVALSDGNSPGIDKNTIFYAIPPMVTPQPPPPAPWKP